jgi:hypothetical protein
LGANYLAEALRSPDVVHRSVAIQRRVFDTTATPFLYSLFGAWSTSDYTANLRAFRALLLGCFVFSVLALSRLLRQAAANSLLCLALLCLWFEPLASDLRVGNVGCLQLSGVVIYAWVRLKVVERYRATLAGLFMGLLIAFKPNLAFVALLPLGSSLLRREVKALLCELTGITLGLAIAVAYTIGVIGQLHVWFDWFTALRNVPSEIITADYGNYAPLVIVGSKLGWFAGPAVGLALLTAVTLGYCLRAPSSRNLVLDAMHTEAHGRFWLLSLGCLGPVLLPHLAWLHYFVMTLPALLFVMSSCQHQTADSRRRWRISLTAVAWLGLSFNPLTTLGLAFTNAMYGKLIIVASVALLAATVAFFRPEASN